jgi:integrase
MQRNKLTDPGIRSLEVPKTGQQTVWDTVSPVGLRISQGGAKTFVVMVGSGRRHVIGRYGEVTLADAREAARRLRAQKTLGRIIPAAMSVADARTEYLEQLDIRPNTRIYYERHLNRLPGRKLGEFDLGEINHLIKRLGTSSRIQALATYKAFFRWCVKPPRRYLEHSPLEGVEVKRGKKRKRTLNDDELKLAWKAAQDQGYPHGTVVQLLILTGQRRSEIGGLRRSWINQKDRTFTLPDTITKNHKEFTFAYGDMTAAILESVPRRNSTEFLFPSRISDDRPLSGWSKYRKELKDGIEQHWTLHDLRRTYRTNHAKIGTKSEIGERLINHQSSVQSDVEAVYDTWTYLPEMRERQEVFEAHMCALLAR